MEDAVASLPLRGGNALAIRRGCDIQSFYGIKRRRSQSVDIFLDLQRKGRVVSNSQGVMKFHFIQELRTTIDIHLSLSKATIS